MPLSSDHNAQRAAVAALIADIGVDATVDILADVCRQHAGTVNDRRAAKALTKAAGRLERVGRHGV